MSSNKKRYILPAILACTTILFAVLFFQANPERQAQLPAAPAASQSAALVSAQSRDDAQLAQLTDRNEQLEQENQQLQAQVDQLTDQVSQQTDALADRQSQIDALWARVDAAQKNLDDAYAKLDARQSASAGGSSGSSGSAGASAASPSSGTSTSQTVYITNTGTKYHRAGCQYLRQSQIAISLSDAKAQGYTACSRCF